jgi:hypothetical protein
MVLIWSAYYRNESKTFWFGPKNCLRQSRTFLFNPKTYRSKQNVLIWSYYYWNESKTFWFGPLIIGKKAKQFDLLPKYTLHVHTAGEGKGYAVHVQTSGCGKGLDLDSIGSVDPDPEWNPDPRGQKWPTKVENLFKNSCFEVFDGFYWELKSSVTWTFFIET